jgi:hypothetical protein
MRGRFNHALTSVAGKLRPQVANDLEAVRNVLQLFGDIFAELAQLTAAIGTRVVMKTVADDLSWQMLGQRVRACFLISSLNGANSSLAVPTPGTFTAFFGNSKSVGGNGLGRNWMVASFDLFSKLLI